MPALLKRLAVACLVAAMSVGSGAHAQKPGGVLRIAHRDNPPSASIWEEATASTDMPFMAVFNNLVMFDPDSPQNRGDRIIPELGTSWTWGADDRSLTFRLHDGVKWHDGKPFTSADVKCTWDMVTGKVESKMRKNPRKAWWFNIREITTNGPLEVTFHLHDPQPSFLTMLAGGFSPVYPCHVSAEKMRTAPIGTGPFKFVEFKQNESISLARNPAYWKPGRPYMDAIEWTIVPNRATMIMALEAGKFDLEKTGEIPPEMVKDVKAVVPNMQCVVQPSNGQGNVLLNREKPPFDNSMMRRAVVLSIDRRAFSDIISHGLDQLGGAMLAPPQGVWGWSPEFMETVPGYGADVEKSREEGRRIMREMGYGPDNPLQIKVTTRNVPGYRDLAVILIDHLKSIYIRAEMEALDSSVWYARLLRKDYLIGMNGQATGIDDPDVMFFEHYSCGSERNYTGYCNPDLEKLFHKQSQMKDFTARRQLVWEIDKRLQEDAARPVVVQIQEGTCWWPEVKGLKLAVNTEYNHWRFDEVWLDR